MQDNDTPQPSGDQIQSLIGLYASAKLEEAETMAQEMTAQFPQSAVLFNIYGAVLAAQGRFGEAIKRYEKALELQPGYVEAHSNLGVACKEDGRLDEAIASQKRALELNPDYSGAHSNLAAALQQAGDLEAAVESYRRALELAPDFVEDYIGLGIALNDLGRLDEAAESFRTAIERRPDFVEAHYNLGNALLDRSEHDAAIASFEKALDIDPSHVNACNNMGSAFKNLARFDDAVASYRRAIEIDPEHAKAHDNLGNIFMELGKIGEAEASYRQALELQPARGEFHRHLSSAKKFTENDEDIARALALYEHPNCPENEKMHLAFALGKAFEDTGEHEKAFGYYRDGNRMKRLTLAYSASEVSGYFERLKEIVSPSFIEERRRGGNGQAAPIFVLGMPRSGTTLIEQMLASHPQVFGAGELDDFPSLLGEEVAKTGEELPESLNALDAAALERIAKRYLQRLKGLGGDTPHVTDKAPHNFLHTGLIHAALPSARIVHVRRDPLDTCFSIYASYFVAPHFYAWDLEELGAYYREYQALMQHWREIAPDAMIEVDYEAVVKEPEAEIRRLLEECGLDFDPACLDFHKSTRAVRTASAAQVRQPLYASSVQRWRNFENHLAPLKKALGA